MFSLKGEFRPFQVVVVPGVLWRTGRHTPIKYSQEYHPLTPPGRCIVTAAKCTKECVARACLLFWSCLLLKDFIQQQKRFSSSECQTNSSTSALIYLYNCKLFFFSFLSITRGQTFQGACKQQRPWPQRKRHEKSEFALLQTLSRLFHLVQFVKCSYFSLELNSEKTVSKFGQLQEKKTKVVVLSSRPPQNVK